MTDHPEIGCYGDGTFGHQHTRERCAEVLEHYAEANFTSRGIAAPLAIYGYADKPTVERLAADLRGEMSDDASEEDTACEWLNTHAPFDGAYWGWNDGDFGLWPESEE
jgi:hypothetical protein